MRDDLSTQLVHLTKGSHADPAKHREEAFANLCSILRERRLRGGTGFIKGGHHCVCFSEAPISKLSLLLSEKNEGQFKYQPYGVLVDKVWLYRLGGRPAIYGPDADYEKLPEEMRYRHVRFWLSDKGEIDHTWEREWRFKTLSLSISPAEVTVVVPDRAAKESVIESCGSHSWHYIALSDLGVKIAQA